MNNHPVQLKERISVSSRNFPTGTLTFLLTDVESSTRLWEQQPEQMRAAMVRHDELIESAVRKQAQRDQAAR
jgi:class 3 adenylate cyclase